MAVLGHIVRIYLGLLGGGQSKLGRVRTSLWVYSPSLKLASPERHLNYPVLANPFNSGIDPRSYRVLIAA